MSFLAAYHARAIGVHNIDGVRHSGAGDLSDLARLELVQPRGVHMAAKYNLRGSFPSWRPMASKAGSSKNEQGPSVRIISERPSALASHIDFSIARHHTSVYRVQQSKSPSLV